MRNAVWLRPLMLPIRPLLLAAALLLLSAPAVLADAPVLSQRVTDQVGVLGSDKPAVEQAVRDLSDAANVDLWVVFVSTMDGMAGPDFAEATYDRNGLGGNDVVLVVAVDEQRYAWAARNAGGLTPDDIDGLCSDNLDPNFRDGDYAGGVIALAQGIQTALGIPLSPPLPAPRRRPAGPREARRAAWGAPATA
jgi:uncharacterized membrane protein YgcG